MFKSKIEVLTNYTNSVTVPSFSWTSCSDTLFDKMKFNVLIVENASADFKSKKTAK